MLGVTTTVLIGRILAAIIAAIFLGLAVFALCMGCYLKRKEKKR
jgi:hypothetical protein